eukprot:238473-Rhodomonas_salina.1
MPESLPTRSSSATTARLVPQPHVSTRPDSTVSVPYGTASVQHQTVPRRLTFRASVSVEGGR